MITVLGARTSESVLFADEFASFAELVVCTDDGSAGRAGFVTDALRDLLATRSVDVVYAAGPVPMMRAVAAVTGPLGVRTIVSLNPIMVDGTGMCGGCRVTVDGTMRFACVDGPEFDGHGVDFDELSDRLSTYRESERAAASHACRGAAVERRNRCRSASGWRIDRQEMPTRDAHERSGTFDEVNLGFTEHLAMLEAQRCLACKRATCVEGCPVTVDIPTFVRQHRGRRPRRSGARALRRQRPAGGDRSGLSAGASVRGGVRPGPQGRAGGDRPPRALRRRLGAGPPAR